MFSYEYIDENIDFSLLHSAQASFADVLQNSCSEKFRKIHMKATVLVSLFELQVFKPLFLFTEKLLLAGPHFNSTFLFGKFS